jgi:hypothetical protein
MVVPPYNNPATKEKDQHTVPLQNRVTLSQIGANDLTVLLVAAVMSSKLSHDVIISMIS